ncbi:uncharacterized protein Z518_02495 [Rhinocladiella mackenziei CBS 650.93]|uniref:NmrA-like domain-containing protein n=1 Tax=Rhinocladiella mackenziei CBS 650.93 TaxID=1442369 RepID=A0A0D2IWS7_9EURO|nr:uncharacterized protein Z518_02495 [Rhinocladiella mackenziei CBS 650.93]KIX07841.1 hypothetical protein Z518_02495 [Rhinocladiella mackenziei CBS 650.93]
MSKIVLITGATGKQGGAVVNALLAANADFQILAVTRDPSSASAQKLAKMSPKIKLVSGNLDHPEDIFRTAKRMASAPIWGVFSVQMTIGSKSEVTEEDQGKALIDASLSNNVSHFIYSSVDRGGDISATNPTEIPHFRNKHSIEQHLFKTTKSSGMTYTVLRPVAFFDNLALDFFGKVFTTSYKIALKEKPLQLIATRDIGSFAAQAFLHPDQWAGKSLSLAGDELTFDQFREIFEKTTEQALPMTYGVIARVIMWMVKDLGLMFRWFYDQGYGADVKELRKLNPTLMDFRTWLERDSPFKLSRKKMDREFSFWFA